MSLIPVSIESSRLGEEQITKLRRKLQGKDNPIVDSNTSAHDAGFRLGVQFVIQHLRDGWGDARPPAT